MMRMMFERIGLVGLNIPKAFVDEKRNNFLLQLTTMKVYKKWKILRQKIL